MVAEMVPERELQPRAFSIMPLVWSLGSIFGPSFGGFFAKPADNLPGLFGHNRFLIKYPFALPNIVASSFFLIGISTGFLFLKACHISHILFTPLTRIRKPSKPNVTAQIQASLWARSCPPSSEPSSVLSPSPNLTDGPQKAMMNLRPPYFVEHPSHPSPPSTPMLTLSRLNPFFPDLLCVKYSRDSQS